MYNCPINLPRLQSDFGTDFQFLIVNLKRSLTLAKKRVVKDYSALSEDITLLVKQMYPSGYADNLLTYLDKDGKKVSALPFETEDTYYLIRMTILEAKRIVKEDEDFDDDGQLKEEIADLDVESDDEFDGVGEDDDDIDDGGSEEDDHIIVTRRRDDDDEVNEIPDDTDY